MTLHVLSSTRLVFLALLDVYLNFPWEETRKEYNESQSTTRDRLSLKFVEYLLNPVKLHSYLGVKVAKALMSKSQNTIRTFKDFMDYFGLADGIMDEDTALQETFLERVCAFTSPCF